MNHSVLIGVLLLGCGEVQPLATDAEVSSDFDAGGMGDAGSVNCETLAVDLPVSLLGPGASHAPLALVRGTNELEPAEIVSPALLSARVDGDSVVWRRDRFVAVRPGLSRVHLELGACRISSEVEVLSFSPFATEVLDVSTGPGAGHGRDRLPDVVLGPPEGGGAYSGSLHVLSLGVSGSITLGFGALQLYDGPGPDFIVFENAFLVAGGAGVFAEPARVSLVTSDGDEVRFECSELYPYEGCAGVRPVLAHPDNDRAPTDPLEAGGDSFDMEPLATLATAIRLVDIGSSTTTIGANVGFDLDSVALIHAWPREVRSIEPEAPTLMLPVGARMLVPRVTARLASGASLRGLTAHVESEDPSILSVESQIILARAPGSTELSLRAGPHNTVITVEVYDP